MFKNILKIDGRIFTEHDILKKYVVLENILGFSQHLLFLKYFRSKIEKF